MSAFQDILNATKERVASPIGGYFVLSWVAWNHKFVLAILFASNLSDRYRFLAEIYPNSNSLFVLWVVKPVATAISILLVVPLLNFVVTLWGHVVNALLNYLRHKVKSVDIVPIEKLHELENEVESFKIKHNKEVRDLNAQFETVSNEAGNIRNENERHVKRIADLEKQNLILRAKNGELSETEENILLAIGGFSRDSRKISEVMEVVGIDAVDASLYARRLQDDLHLVAPAAKTDELKLTNDGVSVVIKLRERTKIK